MSQFLGMFKVEMDSHPFYKDYTKDQFVFYFLEKYGQIDGDHHKTWVLDQIARILKGTPLNLFRRAWIVDGIEVEEFVITTGEPSQEYLDWVKLMKGEYDPVMDEFEYWYVEGSAP